MNRPSLRAALVAALVVSLFHAEAALAAFSRFECLRDLLPISDRGAFVIRRKGHDAPFLINNRFIVIPETERGQVTGFYVYRGEEGWYYDAIESAGARTPIGDLQPDTQKGVYELTAQPQGFETIAILYLPGYNPHGGDKEGPVMLGSSVLPVVGAFVSRPKSQAVVYHNPSASSGGELRDWLQRHNSSRTPAATATKLSEVPHTIVRLATRQTKTSRDIWRPFERELEIRRTWVREHNLDEQSFKEIRRALEVSCKP